MNQAFYEASKKIANDFLQSIVFIDDKAFSHSDVTSTHDFDAYAVTNAFAAKEKICAVYKPKSAEDVDRLCVVAKKADIIVLDWQINLEGEKVPVGAEEEDADYDDPRGPHTLKIIRQVVSDPVTGKGSLKLIIIYTGEIALRDIRDNIYQDFQEHGIHAQTRDFEVYTENVKILIVAKADNVKGDDGEVVSRFIHNQEFNTRVKRYDELPDFILDEFIKLSAGLLANFVLHALSILRNNSFRLIQLFNKELDLSFLTHYLLLPSPDDTKEQMNNIFADSVQALLYYNEAGNAVSKDFIKQWLEDRQFNSEIVIAGKTVTVNQQFVRNWVENGFEAAIAEQWGSALNDEQSNSAKKNKEKWSKLVSPFTNDNVISPNDLAFSILTHHKSIFKPANQPPKLTLGAVVRGTKTGYWVCIQQRCDSVRLSNVTRFLFLPLRDVTGVANPKFHFVTDSNILLQLSKKSFELKTIKFLPVGEEGVIKGIKIDERYFFIPIYTDGHQDYVAEKDEMYEWIFDLKDLHAQRIAADFAHELSRVGLDESEWLRRRWN